MLDDNMAGSHAMVLFEDMFHVLAEAGAVPVRLRAQADAIGRREELDDDAFWQQIKATPLDDLVLARHQPLLERLRSMRPMTERLMFEVLLCRSVDTFLSYVADILAEIFRAKPETLRSEETVTVQQVLAHPNLDEFVAWIADRRINNLSYKGLREIQGFISDRFGLELVTESYYQQLNELIAVRNLLVHQRGVVDQRFVANVGTRFGELGDEIKASSLWASRHVDVPAHVVRSFDASASVKFELNVSKLEVKRYWPEALDASAEPTSPPAE